MEAREGNWLAVQLATCNAVDPPKLETLTCEVFDDINLLFNFVLKDHFELIEVEHVIYSFEDGVPTNKENISIIPHLVTLSLGNVGLRNALVYGSYVFVLD